MTLAQSGPLGDPAAYTLRDDDAVIVAPCLRVAIFVDGDDPAIQQWHDRALEALGPWLPYYRTHTMGQRQRVTRRTPTLLATWRADPGKYVNHHLEYYGCGGCGGVTGAALSISWSQRTWAGKPPEQRRKWLDTWQDMAARGKDVRRMLPCSVLRMDVPLEHSLAAPGALWDWVRALELVASGRFASAYAGYALNFDPDTASERLSTLAERRVAALCLRHPGFDWHAGGALRQRMLPYEPSIHDHLPLVKRANWLTLLSDRTVRWLGGADAVLRQLHTPGGPALEPLGGGAVAIRTAAAPAVGDVERGDDLPAYRAVARAVRPARLDEIPGPGPGFPDDQAQAWLDAFDTPVAPPGV